MPETLNFFSFATACLTMRLFEDRMTTIFFDVDKDGNKQVAIGKLDNIKTIGVVQLPLESFDII